MATQSLRSIYQLKITLKHSQPSIWRRLRVVSTENLADLHGVLQITMGWSDEHLHEFVQDRKRYGTPDQEFPDNVIDEANYRLNQLLKKTNDTLIYVYDFGDSWEHEVVLEKILPFEHGVESPYCLEGARACPPEDIGGIPRYDYMLEVIADPKHEEYEEVLEWLGDDHDAECFDLESINALLKEYCS